MMKVRLVIEGNVQGAGYRAMVKNVARRLRIKGLVRNLDDGNVEVFCECDKKTLNKFIKIIDRKGDPEQPFSLNVEKINVYREGDVNCVGLPKKFGLFETDYRMEIDPVHKDSLERSEIGILILSSMHQDLKEGQNDLKEGQKSMHQDLKEGQNDLKEGQKSMHQDLKEEQKSMHQDMNLSFDRLDEKYGEFAKKMDSMDKSIKEMKDLFAKLVNHFVKE